jgi:hypothetical protein
LEAALADADEGNRVPAVRASPWEPSRDEMGRGEI